MAGPKPFIVLLLMVDAPLGDGEEADRDHRPDGPSCVAEGIEVLVGGFVVITRARHGTCIDCQHNFCSYLPEIPLRLGDSSL